jgi:hypothetical protein
MLVFDFGIVGVMGASNELFRLDEIVHWDPPPLTLMLSIWVLQARNEGR